MMDYKHSVGILTNYVKEIEGIILGLEQSKKIPAIDVDLLLDKTRNFYEMLLMLKKNVTGIDVISEISAKEELVQIKEEVIEEPEPKKEDVSIEIKEQIIEIREIKEEEKILSDKFRLQKKSLNETINQAKTFQDLSTKIQSKPLNNISSAIGLNEKFSFIHNLFRGDTNKYNETIQVLNNSSNFNEAYNFLNENFDWDMNSEYVQKILELIRRKFIIDKNG